MQQNLVFQDFIGQIPAIDKTRLPANAAQTAENCLLESGVLKQMKGTEYKNSLSGTSLKTAYYLPTYGWLTWQSIVDVIPEPAVDSDNRTLYVGDGYPKIVNATLASAGATRRLGVIAATVSLNTLVMGTGDGVSKYTVAYGYTQVDEFGKESALSEVTSPFDLQGGQYVRLSNFVKNSLASTGNDIKYFRLYKRIVGSSGQGDWHIVKARPVSESGTPVWALSTGTVNSTTYVFDCNDAANDLGEIGDNIESENFDPPPDDTKRMVEIQNGVMLACSDHKICPCEPFATHAFPEGYRFEVAETIIDVGVFNESALVVTNGKPYLIGGIDPKNYVKKELPFPYPCVSSRGLVETPIGIFYPSKRGLIWWDGATMKNITEKIIDDATWAALSLSNMISFYHKGAYYAFFSGTDRGFIFDFADQPYIRWFDIGYLVYGGYVDKSTDVLKLICGSASPGIYEMEGASTNLTATWKSREEITPPMHFPFLKVIADFSGSYSITVKIYADSKTITMTISKNGIYRIESGFRAERWAMEVLTQNVPVVKLALGTSAEGLKYV